MTDRADWLRAGDEDALQRGRVAVGGDAAQVSPRAQQGAAPFEGDPSCLVIVDWSAWLHRAFAMAELDMGARVVGNLCSLLAMQPAHLCIALDSGRNTARDRMRHPTDAGWRYKANRSPKPEEFYAQCDKLTRIAELHSIPVLWADGFEADDVIATATRMARAAGYRVCILSADKDLVGLTEPDVYMWDNATCVTTTHLDVERKLHPSGGKPTKRYGIKPSQVADALAIIGDSADNIPGVAGMGPDKAFALLTEFGTLEEALSTEPWSPELHSKADSSIKALAKRVKAGDVTAESERAIVMYRRSVARWHEALCASADVARFSRDLTSLDCDVPIIVPWYEIPIGGYRTDEIACRYRAIGYTDKARRIEDPSMAFAKRQPFAVGEDGSPF